MSLLPAEVLVSIFSFLNASDLKLTALVCSNWHQLSGKLRKLHKFFYTEINISPTLVELVTDFSKIIWKILNNNNIHQATTQFGVDYVFHHGKYGIICQTKMKPDGRKFIYTAKPWTLNSTRALIN